MDERTEGLCLELGRLSSHTDRKRFLAAAPQLIDIEVVRRLAEAVRSAVRVDVRKALALAEAALAIAQELASDEALGLGLRAKANVLWVVGNCRESAGLFDQAAARFEQAGQMNEVGRTLSSSLQALALLGEYTQAFAAATRAREIFSSLGEDWRVARLDINVANIYHRQNRYAEALAAYERAYQQLLPHRDMEGIGVALHNMAVCLIALDDFERALDTYNRVRAFCRQHDMPLLVTQADYNIAYLYYLRGDYTKALDLLRATRESCRKNGDTYHSGLCDLDRSEIYLELNLIEEAVEMAQSSVEHFRQLGMGFESARSLTNLAIAVNAQGDSSRALELFARAKDIALGENNQVWPHLIDLYRAIVLLERGQAAEARELCLTTANFFRSSQLPSKQALSLLLLTRTCLQSGEAGESAGHCNEALRVLEKFDSPMLCYQAYFLRGQIQEACGEPENAYNSYQEARAALEALRSSLERDELKIGLMRNRLEVYTRLIQLCLDRASGESSAEEALSYIEAAKSRTLRDLILGEAQPSDVSYADTETDQHVRELRKDLNWYYHRIEREQLSQEAATAEDLDALKNRARQCEHELLRFLIEAPASTGVAAALRGSSTTTLSQIRNALGPMAALLEYFALGEQIFVAVVARELIKIVPLSAAQTLARRLRMLQFQFSKFRLDRDYVARFRSSLIKATQAHLAALYDNLIAPVDSLLPARDLVVVPYGPLHSLPFHALFDGSSYLIDRFTVSYAPSASIFTHSHRDMEERKGRPLILGVDDSEMPLIREEVQSIAAVLPDARLLFGPDATEQALREYGYESRLIHIASHGYFRQDNPMFSSIKLADSYVNLYDLYHMNLPVDLLTLSGCVTGLNTVTEGDELLGLTRGLLYAGARSLLLSLWDVDDRSTTEFMKDFYGQLTLGRRKADAVRTAMLNLRERYAHPYYWAPFKLTGRALV
ncbi:MAG TPA: CHAT domain-containing tetratricopeptide repeat protein [Bryobacteraceae bacterium]|nr:CHAT domain-containing tetratricopeptide repeat protein [Bryobacteraceae bacterium]